MFKSLLEWFCRLIKSIKRWFVKDTTQPSTTTHQQSYPRRSDVMTMDYITEQAKLGNVYTLGRIIEESPTFDNCKAFAYGDVVVSRKTVYVAARDNPTLPGRTSDWHLLDDELLYRTYLSMDKRYGTNIAQTYLSLASSQIARQGRSNTVRRMVPRFATR